MNEREKMLGNEKIGTLIWKLSAPAMVAMFVGAVYNLVDAIFIGQGVNSLALGGLAIAFPIEQIVMSIAFMVGIGAAAVISISLGQGNREKAYHAAGNSFLFVVVFGLLISITGLIFLDPILVAFGATDNLMPYAREYTRILLYGEVFFTLTVSSNNLIRSEGNAKTAMAAMLTGMILNIILDPIFIFVFHMGVAGAAWATDISRLASFIFVLIYFRSGKSILKIEWRHFKPDWQLYRQIFALGVPAFVRQVSASIIAIIANHVLNRYGGKEVLMTIGGKEATGGDVYIALYGVINRVMAFMMMPMFGVTQGMQPIAGFNFGAKKYDRVAEVVNKSLAILTTIGTFAFLTMMLFPKAILGLFISPDASRAQLISLGIPVLRTIVLMIPIVGIQVVSATLFQSVGRGGPSLFLSLLRQVILLIPLMLILPLFWGIRGVFWSIPIADFVSTGISGLMLRKEMTIFAGNGALASEKSVV